MNTVTLIGRTTKDVELSVKGETKIARFSLAISEGKDKTEFIPLNAFGKTAETLSKYVGKGSLISVEGHIRISHKDEKMFMNIVADRVEFLSTKKPGETVSKVGNDEIDF